MSDITKIQLRRIQKGIANINANAVQPSEGEPVADVLENYLYIGNGSDTLDDIEPIKSSYANVAGKLDKSAGSNISPVYFNDGMPSIANGNLSVVGITGKANSADLADFATNVKINNNDTGADANIKFSIGTGSYSKTINNVANASFASNVAITNNDNGNNANVNFNIGSGAFSKTINNVADALNVSSSINGVSIDSIISSDKTTVKEAIHANSASSSNNSFSVTGYQISSGTDINNLTPSSGDSSNGKIELYQCATSAIASTLGNCPTSNPFTMMAARGGGASANVLQQFIIDDSGASFSRSANSNVFSEWQSSLYGRVDDLTDLIKGTTTIYSRTASSGDIKLPYQTVSNYYAFFVRLKTTTAGSGAVNYVTVPLFYSWSNVDTGLPKATKIYSNVMIGKILAGFYSNDSGHGALGFLSFNSTAGVMGSASTTDDLISFTDCDVSAITCTQGWGNSGMKPNEVSPLLYSSNVSATVTVDRLYGVHR